MDINVQELAGPAQCGKMPVFWVLATHVGRFQRANGPNASLGMPPRRASVAAVKLQKPFAGAISPSGSGSQRLERVQATKIKPPARPGSFPGAFAPRAPRSPALDQLLPSYSSARKRNAGSPALVRWKGPSP